MIPLKPLMHTQTHLKDNHKRRLPKHARRSRTIGLHRTNTHLTHNLRQPYQQIETIYTIKQIFRASGHHKNNRNLLVSPIYPERRMGTERGDSCKTPSPRSTPPVYNRTCVITAGYFFSEFSTRTLRSPPPRRPPPTSSDLLS